MAHLSADERARGVITASAGNHAQGVAFSARHLGLTRADRDAADDAGDQGGCRARARRRGGAGRRLVRRRQGALRRTGRVDRPHRHPPLRRSAGDCRPGHGGARDACSQAREDLAAIFVPGRRRRAAGRHRQLREGGPARRQGDRRRAVRSRRHVSLARGRHARVARSRRHLRRRRRGARGRRPDLPDRAGIAWTKWSASRTTRSARRSRTCSTTRDR